MVSNARADRRLVAILAADLVGYSRLMCANEEGTLVRLKWMRSELIDPKIIEHHGRIVKTTGDGLLVEFASAVEAARCALQIQTNISEHNGPVGADQRFEYRIGIHVGDIISDGVNIAARLEGIAEPNSVYVSDDAYRQIRGKVDARWHDLEPQALKNIAEPMRTWRNLATNNPTITSDASIGRLSIAVLPFKHNGSVRVDHGRAGLAVLREARRMTSDHRGPALFAPHPRPRRAIRFISYVMSRC